MFYFRLEDGHRVDDNIGVDFANAEAATDHAWIVAREPMHNRDGMSGHAWDQWTMSVVDASGGQVLSFLMSDAQKRKVDGH